MDLSFGILTHNYTHKFQKTRLQWHYKCFREVMVKPHQAKSKRESDIALLGS